MLSKYYGLSFKYWGGNSCTRYYSSKESRDMDLASLLKHLTNTDIFTFEKPAFSSGEEEFVICA